MSGVLCEHCTGVCCRYIALPIETPTTRADFDDVRWYLLHENISVFVEDGDWYISVVADCRHLQPDNQCGIYATRPRICRQYTTENCDYHSGDYGWEEHFTCPEHLDEYVRRGNGRAIKKSKGIKDSSRRKRSKIFKKSEESEHYQIGKEVQSGGKGRAGGAHPRRARPRPGQAIAAAGSDLAGVPLPTLGGRSS